MHINSLLVLRVIICYMYFSSMKDGVSGSRHGFPPQMPCEALQSLIGEQCFSSYTQHHGWPRSEVDMSHTILRTISFPLPEKDKHRPPLEGQYYHACHVLLFPYICVACSTETILPVWLALEPDWQCTVCQVAVLVEHSTITQAAEKEKQGMYQRRLIGSTILSTPVNAPVAVQMHPRLPLLPAPQPLPPTHSSRRQP